MPPRRIQRSSGDRALRRRAIRDVRVSVKPEFQGLNREVQSVQRETANLQQRGTDIYNALANHLAPLGAQLQQGLASVQGQYMQGLQGLAGTLGSPVPGAKIGRASCRERV